MRRRNTKKNKWSDHYSIQAKKENFPARSVYKLEEIQKKFKLMKKGQYILDLGCAPGSWLLFAAQAVGESGRVIGIDKKKIKQAMPPNTCVYAGDILSIDDVLKEVFENEYDAVLSDMAPDTSGNKFVDTVRSFELCQKALDIALDVLKSNGSFVCKIFQGEDFKAFSDSVKNKFNLHKIFKPQSCRKASKEIYIIGMGKK